MALKTLNTNYDTHQILRETGLLIIGKRRLIPARATQAYIYGEVSNSLIFLVLKINNFPN